MTTPRATAGPALLLALCACGSTSQPPAGPAPEPRSTASSTAAAQADSVRRSYTPADVDFMSHMIGHHAQAIEMSQLAPSHGASGSIRVLAERIINGQEDEIATMQRWLQKRQLPVPEATPAKMKMKMNGGEHVMLMPGMLTEDQMRRLNAARGPEFDRLFLTFMVQHHQGALTMVEQLFGSHGAAQEETIFKFASDVSADQSTEVARMQTMLAALPPETSSSR
jgi:uncharacterized protein (DUF305 family)